MPKTILFFVRHFKENGTETVIYDYAHYNETLLGNRSLIGYFSDETKKRIGFPLNKESFSKFRNRFTMLEMNDISDMRTLIDTYHIDVFHTLTYGSYEDTYQFNDKSIWKTCKTVKQCVYDTTGPQGDLYLSISHSLCWENPLPVIPACVPYIEEEETMRELLHIPESATVIGRYGSKESFNLSFVQEAIKEIVNDPGMSQVYFLLMNTNVFYEHPRILYFCPTLDPKEKAKFVNTCDAMIHARHEGETCGLSVAEFSVRNKPVLTCPVGNQEHLLVLKEKAVLYYNKEELKEKIRNLRSIVATRTDWNGYKEYSPEHVMKQFATIVFQE